MAKKKPVGVKILTALNIAWILIFIFGWLFVLSHPLDWHSPAPTEFDRLITGSLKFLFLSPDDFLLSLPTAGFLTDLTSFWQPLVASLLLSAPGLLHLATAYGLWRQKNWGRILQSAYALLFFVKMPLDWLSSNAVLAPDVVQTQVMQDLPVFLTEVAAGLVILSYLWLSKEGRKAFS